jgi:hypothetical protein
MTRIVLSAALVAAGVLTASVAHAQSSVTLWGQMDVGINYVSNQGGTHNFTMDDGVNGPDLLGLRGVEDLGGGTKAIFELVDQFSVDTGEFTADQSLFSHVAGGPAERPFRQVDGGESVRIHDGHAVLQRRRSLNCPATSTTSAPVRSRSSTCPATRRVRSTGT